MRIDEAHLRQTAYHHVAVDVLLAVVLHKRNHAQLVELYARVVLCHDRRVGGGIGSHTTGVERTQGKLCSRLTDCLCGNHTDSLAYLHHAACGKVASVTLHADAMLALACEHRTYLYAFDGRLLYRLGNRLRYLLTGSYNELACCRMYDVVD